MAHLPAPPWQYHTRNDTAAARRSRLVHHDNLHLQIRSRPSVYISIPVQTRTDSYVVGINQLLLTVLGFVVGLAISFRTSSAYERYTEGRKYWAQLLFVGQNLARTIWIHAKEREGELGKEDLLRKVYAFNVSHNE